jgi:hypothetical protein
MADTTAPQQHHQAAEKTDAVGIISIVLSVVGFALPGMILGLWGAHEAKRQGYSPVLSRIGWIMGLVFTVLVVLFIVGAVIVAIVADTPEARDERRRRNNTQLIESM